MSAIDYQTPQAPFSFFIQHWLAKERRDNEILEFYDIDSSVVIQRACVVVHAASENQRVYYWV